MLLAVALVAALAVWQIASLLVNSQALAPVTGQYYVGVSWMATPSPTAGSNSYRDAVGDAYTIADAGARGDARGRAG